MDFFKVELMQMFISMYKANMSNDTIKGEFEKEYNLILNEYRDYHNISEVKDQNEGYEQWKTKKLMSKLAYEIVRGNKIAEEYSSKQLYSKVNIG